MASPFSPLKKKLLKHSQAMKRKHEEDAAKVSRHCDAREEFDHHVDLFAGLMAKTDMDPIHRNAVANALDCVYEHLKSAVGGSSSKSPFAMLAPTPFKKEQGHFSNGLVSFYSIYKHDNPITHTVKEVLDMLGVCLSIQEFAKSRLYWVFSRRAYFDPEGPEALSKIINSKTVGLAIEQWTKTRLEAIAYDWALADSEATPELPCESADELLVGSINEQLKAEEIPYSMEFLPALSEGREKPVLRTRMWYKM